MKTAILLLFVDRKKKTNSSARAVAAKNIFPVFEMENQALPVHTTRAISLRKSGGKTRGALGQRVRTERQKGHSHSKKFDWCQNLVKEERFHWLRRLRALTMPCPATIGFVAHCQKNPQGRYLK